MFQHDSGVPLVGEVEVHLRASDFVRHGHRSDPSYNGLVLHLVWEDDRGALAGSPTELPSGDFVVRVAVGPALDSSASRLRELVRLGPSGGEPCEAWAQRAPASEIRETVRAEGRRRLAERAWGAGRIVELNGWTSAWEELLIRALRASAGRRRESDGEHRALASKIANGLGGPALGRRSSGRPLERRPSVLIEALRQPGGPGRPRAVEIGWNAALPLLAAAASAYGDRELAAATAALVDTWPSPRPYGRTETLRRLIGPDRAPPDGRAVHGRGALYTQGMLHVQDLWCERGGCGVCPLSGADEASG